MAGHGPAPKKGAIRRNAGSEFRVVNFEPGAQPELPEVSMQVTVDGELEDREFVWPEQTRQWWSMWSKHPLSADFSDSDWMFLLDTALLHARMWNGDTKVAAELRLRVAKFGATPEDRARLRITFAQADEADAGRPDSSTSAREKFGGLKAVS